MSVSRPKKNKSKKSVPRETIEETVFVCVDDDKVYFESKPIDLSFPDFGLASVKQEGYVSEYDGGKSYDAKMAEFFLFLQDVKKPWFYRLFKKSIDSMLEKAWMARGGL